MLLVGEVLSWCLAMTLCSSANLIHFFSRVPLLSQVDPVPWCALGVAVLRQHQYKYPYGEYEHTERLPHEFLHKLQVRWFRTMITGSPLATELTNTPDRGRGEY